MPPSAIRPGWRQRFPPGGQDLRSYIKGLSMAPGKEVKGVLETFAHSQTPSGTPEPIEPKKEEAGKVGEPAAKVAEKPAEKVAETGEPPAS